MSIGLSDMPAAFASQSIPVLTGEKIRPFYTLASRASKNKNLLALMIF